MKKIKILTIWLLSLWLLGNIPFVSANNFKNNLPLTACTLRGENCGPITPAGRERIQKVEGKTAWIKTCDLECQLKKQEEERKKKTEELNKKPNAPICNGIKLNTNFPFVGSCIGFEWGGTNQINVFPKMVKSLMKLIISVIMLMSLIIIIIAGVMVTSSGYDSGNYKKGLDLINKVATGLALLGASGVILKLINPNFFT